MSSKHGESGVMKLVGEENLPLTLICPTMNLRRELGTPAAEGDCAIHLVT